MKRASTSAMQLATEPRASYGRWRVRGKLDRGGMGVIYTADDGAGRRGALKLLREDTARDRVCVARFRREAEALAALHHPNVVALLEAGVDEGALYLVTELLDGAPLRRTMLAAMPWPRALAIAIDVCAGLAAVHAAGLVHRDVKPENVFLTGERAKLLDFGIALDEDATTTSLTGAGIVGTPGYISPERLRGERADARADVYALGVLLFELIAGRLPFTGSLGRTLVQTVTEDAPRLRSFQDVPEALDDVVARMLARDPALRPRDGDTVLALLRDIDVPAVKLDDATAALFAFAGELHSFLASAVGARDVDGDVLAMLHAEVVRSFAGEPRVALYRAACAIARRLPRSPGEGAIASLRAQLDVDDLLLLILRFERGFDFATIDDILERSGSQARFDVVKAQLADKARARGLLPR